MKGLVEAEEPGGDDAQTSNMIVNRGWDESGSQEKGQAFLSALEVVCKQSRRIASFGLLLAAPVLVFGEHNGRLLDPALLYPLLAGLGASGSFAL